ncbi:MAG: HtaA domain-containing protein [Rothia sp. (in: high G+C Gram-positive bacteria)]|uniref:HtaA domain-containing protein n=1 Tax=Rothia sp. (in: high G+C Gram-positive bacteria) TaxID=1885016 RepID=UPI0026F83914|nr:HtaA domain-containing protein [Rothia sp. (in: high G+C Gram-positive bacteria)]
MSLQHSARRSCALLATAALTLSGMTLVAASAADAADAPSSTVAAASATHTASNAKLTWSLKDSFIRYVTGAFAGGSVEVTGGPSFNGSTFSWEGAEGEFTGAQGTINYPGTIHFTAHHGALDITYANLKLVINGNQGTLVADVKSKSYNGSPDVDATGVSFATVDLAGVTFSNGTVSATNAPVTLTAEGADAFAGFYKAGEVLSPLSFSADLTEKPAETPAPAPTPEPTADGVTNAAGTVTWGIKDSFLNYLLAQNAVTPGEKTSLEGNNFVFAGATAQTTDTGYSISVPGSFSLTAHGGVLNINLHSFRVVTDGAQGYIYATGTSANTGEITDQPIASFDASALTTDAEGNLLLSGVTTYATEHAASIFGSRYAAGLEFDPLYLRVAAPVVEDAPALAPSETPAPSPSAEPTTQPAVEPTTTPSAQPTEEPAAQPSTNPADPAPQCVPVTVAETVAGATSTQADGTVSAATFNWGVRSSFRNYIGGGIAQGGWELTDTTYSNSTFNWANGSGTYSNGKGSISFTGSVRFTGHKGTLNTLMANPRLEINGSTGTLYLTVTSNNTAGVATNYGEVAFATVDTSSLTVNGSTISLSGASATLTEAGAAAFAGFYSAGMALDPISFTGTLGSKTITGASQTIEKTQYVSENGANCDALNAEAERKAEAARAAAQGGKLANTGASVGALVAVGAALLAAGAVVVARRRAS